MIARCEHCDWRGRGKNPGLAHGYSNLGHRVHFESKSKHVRVRMDDRGVCEYVSYLNSRKV